MKIIKSDIKRALTSWGFWAGSAGMIIAILIGASEAIVPVIQKGIGEGLPEGFHAQTLLTALSSDIMLLSVPILCALPFTSAFVDDYKSGFIKQYLPRSGRGSYIKGKLVATGISGGLTLFFGHYVHVLCFCIGFYAYGACAPARRCRRSIKKHGNSGNAAAWVFRPNIAESLCILSFGCILVAYRRVDVVHHHEQIYGVCVAVYHFLYIGNFERTLH